MKVSDFTKISDVTPEMFKSVYPRLRPRLRPRNGGHLGWSSVELFKIDLAGQQTQIYCNNGDIVWMQGPYLVYVPFFEVVGAICTTADEAAEFEAAYKTAEPLTEYVPGYESRGPSYIFYSGCIEVRAYRLDDRTIFVEAWRGGRHLIATK